MLADGFHEVPPGKITVIVTDLEMTAPAPLRGVPLPAGLSFDPLPRDPALYQNLFRRVGQNWLWFSRLAMKDTELAEILSDKDVSLWTLHREGIPEALLELDFREPETSKLAFFGVTPPLIGTGAGAYLMDRAIEQAWSRPITRFHVQTCTADSPQALPFYVKSGFTPYRRQIEVADDPRLTGELPRDLAPHIPAIP